MLLWSLVNTAVPKCRRLHQQHHTTELYSSKRQNGFKQEKEEENPNILPTEICLHCDDCFPTSLITSNSDKPPNFVIILTDDFTASDEKEHP